MQYKLRAETREDLDLVIDMFALSSYTILPHPVFSDVELEFKTNYSLEEIRELLKDVPDAHVMRQTVALKQDYTGERDHEL
ncbi:hypothetical protein [Adhaeribacter rhizoryzae]|uniref:Uncharacterized protein n=1 Tax=Adhaeribacter rhizoryzae TaxID=2607907 RepID=A0A5M6DKL5_9BACT|nr:hypothetical protein [Adhaeribacter rhizoryzae]KAA5548094.1 hypothetical protein F0145_05040 [Adhaeribacter rhizoryzae]